MFSHCTGTHHIYYLHREHDANRINYMYAQYVKNTMEPLNIPDVRKDRRFPWTVSNPILAWSSKAVFPPDLYFTVTLQLTAWPQNWLTRSGLSFPRSIWKIKLLVTSIEMQSALLESFSLHFHQFFQHVLKSYHKLMEK